MSVLQYLAERPGQLVTKQDLLDAVWLDTFVQEGVLKSYIKEIRKALGDDADEPRYIRTEHRRGYRFLAQDQAGGRAPNLLGRGAARAILLEAFSSACKNKRQVIFLTGEPGIGKTTLLNAFLAEIRSQAGARIGRGQCTEQSGAGESHLPFFGALADLCTGDSTVVSLLRRHAPTWLVQMPALVDPREREGIERELLGASGARAVREIMDAFAQLSRDRPLVLALEDLHWSDLSTVELLAALARQPQPSQLMIVATYRPVDVILAKHPVRALKQELAARDLCQEVALELLTPAEVETYLRMRIPEAPPPDLAVKLHRQTDGNPLFLVKLTDHWLAQRLANPAQDGDAPIPDTLRQMVLAHFERLSASHQRVLEAGAVIGQEFATDAVAAALDAPLVEIEDQCEALSETGQFLRSTDADSPRFAFIHALYREGLYDQIPRIRRRRLHRAVGQHGERHREDFSAATLAHHFEAAGEPDRAVDCLQEAARHAARNHAQREALQYLVQAAALVRQLPAESQGGRDLAIGQARAAVLRNGGDAQAAAAECMAAANLARNLGLAEGEVEALLDACTSLMWTDRKKCLETVEQATAVAARFPDSLLEARAIGYRAFWHLYLLNWTETELHVFQKALAQVETEGTPAHRALFRYLGAAIACHRGEYTNGLLLGRECETLAIQTGDPYDFLAARHFQGWALLHSGQWSAALVLYREAADIAGKNGFVRALGLYQMGEAWLHLEAGEAPFALAVCEPIWRQLLGSTSSASTGSFVYSAQVLAGALLQLRRTEEAAKILDQTDALCRREQRVVESSFEIPFRLRRAECFGKQENWPAARAEAQRALELAAAPPEPTYLALSYRMMAEIAHRDGDRSGAQKLVALACAALEGRSPSLADWRVFTTAAQIEADGTHADQARQAVEALAADLMGEAKLRDSFLAFASAKESGGTL